MDNAPDLSPEEIAACAAACLRREFAGWPIPLPAKVRTPRHRLAESFRDVADLLNAGGLDE